MMFEQLSKAIPLHDGIESTFRSRLPKKICETVADMNCETGSCLQKALYVENSYVEFKVNAVIGPMVLVHVEFPDNGSPYVLYS